jgi:GTP-binding protein
VKILEAEMLTAAAQPSQFPQPELPEVAFLGRSNVGKSSLLNKLVQRRKLARTSSTPGKTRLIHWYRVRRPDDALCFVDLPGYGYAKVSKSERKHWQALIEAYLEGRESLCAAVLLQDVRRDLSEEEDLLIAWLRERGVPVVLAITKCDKLKPQKRSAAIAALRRDTDLHDSHIIPTSAEKGTGIDELWSLLDTLPPPPPTAGGEPAPDSRPPA